MENKLSLVQLEDTNSPIKLFKKRKLANTRGVCNSFVERTQDHNTFSMPDLDNDSKNLSSKSISAKRGIQLKLSTQSDASHRSNSIKSCKLSEEIAMMKKTVKNKSGFGNAKDVSKNLSYLFAIQPKPKSDKETRISDCLSSKGIFQIHLSEVLKYFH